ncbi:MULTISPECIES: DUF5625 family protein [Pseudomonas]|uniref:DUF5625 family protein n=1 Tax=Pseudomonas TaxID=286 RepID=UPI0004E135EA|nr:MULTISPECIES: DUF5625 family protein [Pseudomonas]KAA3532670.1 hypothetical protein DXU85_28795 [Pseudomonas savastanoi]KPY66680.1 Uncharacterized protein ALO58_01837 [Pseudomonas savastanoi pv. savastanoi]KWS42789.1 hypothetical protein AL058_02445 [Pseudomonas savastanoi pv. nerii]PAB25631.1 hypothetical protein CC202_24565 [Pseudomonas savastanoi]RMT76215.1 hypothetical protein ALP41_03110 [Pseudomonas savastanoi pv. nerii]
MSFLKSFFTLLLCVFFGGCSGKVLIVKPIDVSLPSQSAAAHFSVSERGGYRIALLFVWSKSKSEADRQGKIWGGDMAGDKGIPISVHLRVLKDRAIFFDEIVMTEGVDSGQAFEYEGDYKSAQVRDIKHLALLPGEYTVEVLTLERVDAFSGIESYIEFSYYNPKI